MTATISQKCQYALRGAFHLAKRHGHGPVRIAEIAEVQAIPRKFLESILVQLKQGGFIESERGSNGGYLLARSPGRITVGDIVRFIEGPIGPVDGMTVGRRRRSDPSARGVFHALWEEVGKAVSEIYDGRSLKDLVDQERDMSGKDPGSYSI